MPRVLGDNNELDLTPVLQELMALRKRTVVSTCREWNPIAAVTHAVHSQNGAFQILFSNLQTFKNSWCSFFVTIKGHEEDAESRATLIYI